MRIVLDTNVLISAALLDTSVPYRAFEKAFVHCEILISAETFKELGEVISRRKFDKYISPEKRLRFLAEFSRIAIAIEVGIVITDCSDPKDNKFLELAVSGNADYNISGDDDLLQLDPFRRIPVITPHEFLKISF